MNRPSEKEIAELVKTIYAGGGTLQKSFTQSSSAISGITEYDLEPGARLLYPLTTILRNMIPRRTGGRGIQANWRAITAVNPSKLSIGLSQGNRGGIMGQTVVDRLAKFAFFGMDNSVTFEADYAGEGFDNVRGLAVTELLQGTMEAEERVILGGNAFQALGTTPTPTTSTATTGGLITNATWSVVCVALTFDGAANSDVTNGVQIPYTRTNADGSTDVISGFYAAPSAAASQVTTGTTSTISASVTAVNGAFAYAWFAGASGSERLQQITSINSVKLTAAIPGTGQLLSALTSGDQSINSLVYDGLLSQIFTSGSGSYVKSLATGTAGTGTNLTSTGSGTGGIAEIDAAIESFYRTYRLIPTHIIMNSVDQKNAKNLILSGNTNLAPFFMAGNELSGSARLKTYVNPIGFGNPTLEVLVHPFMPQGTMMFYSDRVPYQLTNVADICKVHLRRDYYSVDWPVVTRKWTYGVYFDGVLQHYFPPAMGMITNIAP